MPYLRAVMPGRPLSERTRNLAVVLPCPFPRESGSGLSGQPGMTAKLQNYCLSLIGGATFSAGAGGSADLAPSFCAS
jgi:hypothetical protein